MVPTSGFIIAPPQASDAPRSIHSPASCTAPLHSPPLSIHSPSLFTAPLYSQPLSVHRDALKELINTEDGARCLLDTVGALDRLVALLAQKDSRVRNKALQILACRAALQDSKTPC